MGRKSRAKKQRRQGIQPAAPEPAPPKVSDRPIPVNDATFDRTVLTSEVPVLVDFWAPWCGPCRAVAPILDELARERAGELLIVKYDTSQSNGVAGAMNIRSIPAMVLFDQGEVVATQVGAMPKPRLVAWLDRALKPKRSLMSRLLGRDAETADA